MINDFSDEGQDTAALIAAARKQKQAAGPDDTATLIAQARSSKRPRSLPTDANNQATPGELVAAGHDDEQPGIAGSLADVAQGIPGVGALEAGARSVLRNQPYREAYQDIKRQTDKVPTSAKIVGRTAASVPLMEFLPGSAAKAGALIGGASEALDANPDRGLLGRIGMGAVGAATGGILGKAFEMVPTGIRALAGGNPASSLLEKQAARAASARHLYSTALTEGQGRTGTQAIQSFLAEPDIADIVGELQTTRPFQNVAHDSPEMLDAVYKTLSDRAATLKKGLESVTPTRPNIGRFRLNDTRAAQQSALNATDTAMPTYRNAVEDYATQSGDIDAFRKGYDASRSGMSGNLPSSKQLTRSTPEAVGEWAARATNSQRANAAEGATGAVRSALFSKPLTTGRRAVGDLPSLLRQLQDPTQARIDLLTKLGLIGTNNARQ